jgi:hypothetical protein
MTENSLTVRAQEQRRALGLPDHPTRDLDPQTGRARVTISNVEGAGLTVTPTAVVLAALPEERLGVRAASYESPDVARLLDPIVAERAELARYEARRLGGFRRVFRFGTSQYLDGRDD